MNSETTPEHEATVSPIKKHQFLTFLVSAIIIALFLVYIALSLYHSSGTFQLDLSRPGFDQAREDVTKESQFFEGYPSNGPINEETLAEFNALYNQELKDATAIDAYSGDALSDSTLQIPAS